MTPPHQVGTGSRDASRWTVAVFSVGSLTGGALFLVGLVLQLGGRAATLGDPLDPGAIAASLMALEPWGWSTAGVIAMLATPVAGLVVTAFEVRTSSPRTAVAAAGVVAVLALGLAVALVR